MKLKRCIIVVLFLILFVCAALNLWNLWHIYPLISVRSDGAFDLWQQQTILTAVRESTRANAHLQITFWYEKKVSLQTTWRVDTPKVVTFYGECADIYPAHLVAGRFPGLGEAQVCAVSNVLAQTLWGSTDILGQEVFVNGSLYKVTGIFQDKTAIALCGGPVGDAYNNIEFSGCIETSPTEFVQRILQMTDVEHSIDIFFPLPWMTILTLYALLPLILLVCRAFLRLFATNVLYRRRAVAVAVVFISVFFLPVVLRMLPSWLVPARWSDFSYWKTLPCILYTALAQFFSILPTAKDVLAKWYTFKTLVNTFIAMCFACRIDFLQFHKKT